MSSEFWDSCHGRWHSILSHWIDQKFLRNENGPCVLCGGKDRFRFDDNGVGNWFCNKCSPRRGDGMCLLMKFKGWDFKTAMREVNAILGNCTNVKQETKPVVDKMAIIKRIYNESVPMDNTLAEAYLSARCVLPDRCWCRDIRFHQAIFVPQSLQDGTIKENNSPALVCITRNERMEAVGIQATFLNNFAEKAYKKRWNYGRIGNGVWIGPKEGADVCVVSEGIETCLSSIHMAQRPGWACLGKGVFKSWEPNTKCGPHKKVLIYGDNDLSFGGQAASYQMAERLTTLGIECEVYLPPCPGTDWNDVCSEEAYIVNERLGIKCF